MNKKIVYIFCIGLCLLSQRIYSNELNVRAEIDTNFVLIGDQITLQITATASPKSNIIFPVIKDSIGKIEFLSALKTDTLSRGEKLTLTKKYIITCFDSGQYILPSLPVILMSKNNLSDTGYTNPVSISFKTVDVDTSKAIKDIKPIMEEPISFWELIPYFVVGIVAVLLLFAGLWLYKKYMKKPGTELDYDPTIPPHILALESLKELESRKLWQKGEIKLYHSRISDIIRLYIERHFKFIALEMTTNEIAAKLIEINCKKELVLNIKKVLELSDLVKFAKYQPLPDENGSSMSLSIDFVERTTIKDVEIAGEGE